MTRPEGLFTASQCSVAAITLGTCTPTQSGLSGRHPTGGLQGGQGGWSDEAEQTADSCGVDEFDVLHNPIIRELGVLEVARFLTFRQTRCQS